MARPHRAATRLPGSAPAGPAAPGRRRAGPRRRRRRRRRVRRGDDAGDLPPGQRFAVEPVGLGGDRPGQLGRPARPARPHRARGPPPADPVPAPRPGRSGPRAGRLTLLVSGRVAVTDGVTPSWWPAGGPGRPTSSGSSRWIATWTPTTRGAGRRARRHPPAAGPTSAYDQRPMPCGVRPMPPTASADRSARTADAGDGVSADAGRRCRIVSLWAAREPLDTSCLRSAHAGRFSSARTRRTCGELLRLRRRGAIAHLGGPLRQGGAVRPAAAEDRPDHGAARGAALHDLLQRPVAEQVRRLRMREAVRR